MEADPSVEVHVAVVHMVVAATVAVHLAEAHMVVVLTVADTAAVAAEWADADRSEH